MDNLDGLVYIANQKIPLRSYSRGTTQDMVSRFGSAEKGQTNLDSLKAETQKSFRGGMFQKQFDDPEMADYIRGAHHNKLDDSLYFTPAMGKQSVTGGSTGKDTISANMSAECVTAHCIFNSYLYIAYRNYPVGAITNRIDRIDLRTNTRISLTLPTTLSNSSCPITTMIAHKDNIFMSGKIVALALDLRIHRMVSLVTPGGASDFKQFTSGSANKLISFRGKLYHQAGSHFYLTTNEFDSGGVAKHTTITDSVGRNEPNTDSVQNVLEFNGAVYILKKDGLFRFDGVEVNVVFNFSKNTSDENFRLSAVFNGRLYFVTGNLLYEFDGTNLTALQDFSDAYRITRLEGGQDRLWIGVRYNKTSKSIYPNPNFTDPIEVTSYTYAIISYNGVGFFEYASEVDTYAIDNSKDPFGDPSDPAIIAGDDRIAWIIPDLYVNGSLEARSDGYHYYNVPLASDYLPSAIGDDRIFEVYSSAFDMGYPAINKTLNGISVEADGFDTTNVVLDLYVRTTINGVKSSWNLAWSSKNVGTSGATSNYYLHDEATVGSPALALSPQVFDKVEYYMVGTIAASHVVESAPRVQSVTLRYTLQPRSRKTWAITIPINGVDHSGHNTPDDETRESNQIRKVLTDAYDLKKPVLLYDVDYSKISYITGGSFKAWGENWIAENDVLAVKPTAASNWINRRVYNINYNQTVGSSSHNTAFTFAEHALRRVIGASSAATSTIDVGAEIRKSHAVYVKSIQTETIIIDENTKNDHDGHSDYNTLMIVELLEV